MALDSQAQPQPQPHSAVSDIAEEEEVETLGLRSRSLSLYERVHEQAERFATTAIGQFAIGRFDRLLKVLELTTRWSLPQGPEKQDLKLARPLPWLPFLLLILLLRLLRGWLSLAALLIGNGPVTPQHMIYFIQTRRRKLRSIRVHGLKVIRMRELDQVNGESMSVGGSTGSGYVRWLLSKLRSLLSSAICRPGVNRDSAKRIFIHGGQFQAVQSDVDRQASKRPRDEDSANVEPLSLRELLTKYANEDSEDDSDFIPNPSEETNEEDMTSSGTGSSCDEAEPGSVERISDASVVLANDKHSKKPMPKPVLDVKQEKVSDIDSGNELMQMPRENGTELRDMDVAQSKAAPPLPPQYLSGKLQSESLNNASSSKMEQCILGQNGSFGAAAARDAPRCKANHSNSNSNSDSDTLSLPAPPPTPNHSNAPTSTDLSLLESSYHNLAALLTAQNDDNDRSSSSSSSSVSNGFTVNDQLLELQLALEPSMAPNSLESSTPTLTSASSSEDIFYSPIGSPPDFDSFQDTRYFRSSTASFSRSNEDLLNTSMAESLMPASTAAPLACTRKPQRHPKRSQNQAHRKRGRTQR